MYSNSTVRDREAIILHKLHPSKVKIQPAGQTFRKKYRDWTGHYNSVPLPKAPNAYNRPMKRPVYDSYADTRGAWIRP